ncbi:MAG: hypothetical protein AB3N18_03335 [Allomuricauda sp.]
MENCITCNCIEEVVVAPRPYYSIVQRITNFLTTFIIEGAEELSKIK